MRVFCPVHQVAFLSPRRSPIRCENKGHVLGELHLEERSDQTPEIQWQYCCNCEHFCPIVESDNQLQRCPVCNRDVSTLYLCDRCFTFSFESNTPIQTKNFTFTTDGAPQPSCPGCLQETTATLHEHDCDQLGKQFITALNSCPICLARLDVGPVFPSSVADYVKRIKAANKLTVTFDYESGVFTDVDDGEFLLIRKTLDGGGSIVLPRAARFESRKDFYELYQDYYHCNNFNAGDVQVIEPCRVEPLLDGWKLQSMGTLEVVNDQPRPKKQENAHIERNIVVQEQRRGYMPVEKQETPTRTCSDCGALVETRYAFCWKCGNPMTSHSRNATRAIETIGPSREIVFDYEDATVEHKVSRSQPLFSSLAPELREASRSGMLRMIGIGIVVAAFLLIPLGLLVLIRSASNSTPATVPQNATSQSRTEGVAPGTKEKANGTGDSIPQVSQLPRDEEDELRRLRAERLNIAASDRPRLIQSILGLEKRYPNDYRFPYERAKLAINQQDKMSHEEAFSALSLAAEKAIKSERAEEMLDGLETDKTTDFHKLSHGHREWTQIVDALKGNDVTLLARNSQF